MVVAVVEFQGTLFRWNLSSNVGPGQQNALDDVELVRFGYICMKQNAKFPAPPSLQTALLNMLPFGPFGQDLADVISVHQQLRGGTQDGIVSVAKVSGASKSELYDRRTTWIILALNNNMLDITDDIYPRIDKHLQSGPTVSLKVKQILTRSQF
jgi:hypothetical protein